MNDASAGPTRIVVVDTDVVSYVFREDSRAALYQQHLDGALLIVSFMAVAELERWTIERNWGAARRASLEEYLDRFTVRPSTRLLCRTWAEVIYGARLRGMSISVADAWHAATALVEDAPLVSHNGRDYAGVPDLRLISESEAGA